MSLAVRLLLFSFSKATVVGFPLGLLPVSSLVLDHFSSARYGFHLMECILKTIRKWLCLSYFSVFVTKHYDQDKL